MAQAGRTYGRGAAILSAGIGLTGLITFAYFSLASHALSEEDYGQVALLWSAIFITVSVLYRPVEQLLSRTIADRDARGVTGGEHLRVAATIQLVLGAAFAIAGLLLRDPIQDDLLGGSATLYWTLIATVLAYAASYFARGFLAGHRHFALYGGLVLMESSSRFLFALAVTLGLLEGQGAVALGMAAAPIVSLAVVPPALARRFRAAPPLPDAGDAPPEGEFTLSHGTGFALAVLLIMLAEQTFLNAGPLLVRATEGESGAAQAGFVFNVLLLARAPLVLFQAVQTSILPHLTRLWVSENAGTEADSFRRSVNVTLAAIAAFAGCVALAMLAAGPFLMGIVFGGDFDYERAGLVLVALAMGLYLSAATLNQALLAQGRAASAAACWVACATGFVLFLLISPIDDPVLSVEATLLGVAAALCALLYALYRRA
ncbi:MAG: oligosaccharide flippase family protein [Thermoleophilaceae bacterium]|nr:oligosaccharide flippase family protein [Thermoleophilaceae bacterium]